MDRLNGRQFGQRLAVWVLITGGHTLLAVLLFGLEPRNENIQHRNAKTRSVSIWLDLTPPTASPPAEQPQSHRAGNLRKRKSGPSPSPLSQTITTPDAISLTDKPTEASSAPSSIDWQREAELSARAAAEALIKKQPQCDPSGRPGSRLPKCKKPSSGFQWDPEPGRVGFAGGLPYVRLGERCVLGLGFFGCAAGKLPQANGRLLDDMRDPDRPRSSVPEIESNEFLQGR